jgi:uncharacterized protein YrrD
MFHTWHDLTDVPVVATDGKVGRVCNLLFDDQSWKVRYFVVDLRSWLTRREVVVSASLMDRPNWKKKLVRALITREEVRHSPGVDSAKPVARQQKLALREYYGWPATWRHFGEFSIPSSPTGREFSARAQDDPHLRSTNDMEGYELWNKRYPIGRLENFILDDGSWLIRYLEVRSGDWLHRRSLWVSTAAVESLSWARHRVNVRLA